MSTSADLASIRGDWITPAALTGLLGQRFPGARVEALEILNVIRGTATKILLGLSYNQAGREHGLPNRVWLKGGLEAHSPAFRHLYEAEAAFYRDIAPRCGANCAQSLYEFPTGSEAEPVVLLEDLNLRAVRFGHPQTPLSLEQARVVLELQARYHSAFWSDTRHKEFQWLSDSSLVFTSLITSWTEAGHWDTHMRLPRADGIPPELKDRNLIRNALLRMVELDLHQAHCIIHGDPHVGNLFFERDGRPGYLDWQTVMRGCWAHDVAEFMVTALSVNDRRRHERDLLAHYLGSLSALGIIPPSTEEAWRAYSGHLIWGFMWALCPTLLQSEDVCTINAERAGTAIFDLAVIDTLGFRS